MIIVAESGSTKTEFIGFAEGHEKLYFKTAGFNPYVQSREEILGIIKNEVFPYLKDKMVEKIFFYGAGCSTEENRKLMYSCFKNFFNLSAIEIEHDLIAAARGIWHKESGIVAILGTGSNSCVYNGESVVKNIPSLGYILGDEGSGAHMGKKVVSDFIYRKMPEKLMKKLKLEYQMNTEKALNKVYKSESPNRWLASFSFFIRDNIKEEYCRELVLTSLRAFFDCHISQYEEYRQLPLGVAGSIAFHYKDFLKQVSEEYGFNLARIEKSPIEALVNYHKPAKVKNAK